MMQFRIVALLALVAGVCGALADTLQLKDDAALTGRILAEKEGQVFVDLGFTVLAVPRTAIEQITRGSAPPAVAATSEVPAPGRLYRSRAGAITERSVREWVALLGEAVVQIRTPSSLGSGFMLTPEGHLVTNFHVIEGETQLSVEVYHVANGRLDRRVYRQIRILASNRFADLALLKIEDADAPAFATVPLGNSDALSVGQRVFAIGSPLGLERTVTEGIISTTTRQFTGDLYLQTSAQINPGNSGGPLFDLAGQVIGVINMKVTAGEGIGFAIPVNALKEFLDHRDAFAYSNENPNNPYRYLEPPARTRAPAEATR
jgi:serine protease Do